MSGGSGDEDEGEDWSFFDTVDPPDYVNLGTEALKPDPEFPVVGFKLHSQLKRIRTLTAKGRRRCWRKVAAGVGEGSPET